MAVLHIDFDVVQRSQNVLRNLIFTIQYVKFLIVLFVWTFMYYLCTIERPGMLIITDSLRACVTFSFLLRQRFLSRAPAFGVYAFMLTRKFSSHALVKSSTVLMISGCSPTLEKIDFTRCYQHGKHLPWPAAGRCETVVALRDFRTLQRTGDYLLIFSTTRDSIAFIERARALHKINSLPPNQMPNVSNLSRGADMSDSLKNFTLTPPSKSLSIHYINPSTLPYREILSCGGILATRAYTTHYLRPSSPLSKTINFRTQINEKTPNSSNVQYHCVLTWFTGRQPSIWQIVRAIDMQGRARNLRWKVSSIVDPVQRCFYALPDTIISQPILPVLQNAANRNAKPHSNSPEFSSSPTKFPRFDKLGPYDIGRKPWDPSPRWKVVFNDLSEARRFARSWNARPFPWAKHDHDKTRETMTHAEFVW